VKHEWEVSNNISGKNHSIGHYEYERTGSNIRTGIFHPSSIVWMGDEEFGKRLAITRIGFGTDDHTCRNRDVRNNI
jgi:hypothetical protein